MELATSYHDPNSSAEINRRFLYKQSSPARVAVHESIRHEFAELAHKIDREVPNGREKALALTELQSALMWANAAIATTNEVNR